MRTRLRRTAVLVASAGLLAALPGNMNTAQAVTKPKPWPVVGTLQTGCNDFASKVKRGGSLYVTMWYRQQSPVMFVGTVFDVIVWNDRTGTPPSSPGASVSWLNQQTNHWVSSTVYSPGQFDYYPPYLKRVPPGFWAHIDLRISFSNTADPGSWSFNCGTGGDLESQNGTFDPALLRGLGSFTIYGVTLER